MTFKEELQALSGAYKSAKLDAVKKKLQAAASRGSKSVELRCDECDEGVIKWLEYEGFQVCTARNISYGDYLTVSWDTQKSTVPSNYGKVW